MFTTVTSASPGQHLCSSLDGTPLAEMSSNAIYNETLKCFYTKKKKKHVRLSTNTLKDVLLGLIFLTIIIYALSNSDCVTLPRFLWCHSHSESLTYFNVSAREHLLIDPVLQRECLLVEVILKATMTKELSHYVSTTELLNSWYWFEQRSIHLNSINGSSDGSVTHVTGLY